MEFIATLRIVGAATLLLVSNYCAAQEASDERIPLMFTNGLVKSEGTKLDSCTVIVYQNNDSVHSQVTGRSGKYELLLKQDQEYGIIFQREGFVPKRIMIDTHAKITPENFASLSLAMVINLMKAEKFDGANTDALDFPFAIMKYDPKLNGFGEDPAYTAGVMRTNGALLLAAGRSGK
ncbi:MAG: hypothetical protein IPI00_14355 [Flavobacteriales bacterium]|nr:hypothetical protein [Flavobacteriales bacterium]MBK6944536.1 hypothetical protein [Flavobacteriales bacterium]MBK7241313.1 hypothetical protein [Flavobacteriales bacterium]MBK7298171.1 hypothetical protein [Flavobacteriales bacterium]MBK9534192.1 hypothetical protein [Flavobacteriales bacterium]